MILVIAMVMGPYTVLKLTYFKRNKGVFLGLSDLSKHKIVLTMLAEFLYKWCVSNIVSLLVDIINQAYLSKYYSSTAHIVLYSEFKINGEIFAGPQ